MDQNKKTTETSNLNSFAPLLPFPLPPPLNGLRNGAGGGAGEDLSLQPFPAARAAPNPMMRGPGGNVWGHIAYFTTFGR